MASNGPTMKFDPTTVIIQNNMNAGYLCYKDTYLQHELPEK